MKGGVLIIGSLFWDIHQNKNLNVRKDWRRKRLKFDQRIHVVAPIRYGRASRNGVYTMVFSKSIETDGNLGTAYVAPFKNEIKSFQGIYSQAKFLSYAEGANDTSLVKRADEKIWCVIGILFNPGFDEKRKQKLLDLYQQKLNEENLHEEYTKFCIAPEPSILSSHGEINIDWPKAVNPKYQHALKDLDFIIATCPEQNLSSYPKAATIKKSVLADARDYFYNNVACGITTYQDREIKEAK